MGAINGILMGVYAVVKDKLLFAYLTQHMLFFLLVILMVNMLSRIKSKRYRLFVC